jgi:hypothetical protein
MKTGVELIAEERSRQISQEGWTPEHDDEHRNAEMANAAACYARMPHAPYVTGIMPASPRSPEQRVVIPHRWPWDAEWWKPCPTDRVRELVKAGALIAAEIDRLQRKKEPTP